MRKISLKAVIFDIDDTLISEYDFVLSGYKKVCEKLCKEPDIPLSYEELYDTLLDISRGGFLFVYDRLFDRLGIDRDLPENRERIKDLIRIYQTHDPDIRLYDDVDETLTELKKRGCRLGIVSDGDPARQRKKLKVCDAEKYFDCVIITDELGGEEFRKPDPRSFEKLEKELKTDLKDMIYVGDNPSKDFYLKKVLPIKTARIIRPRGIYTDREYREGIKEDYRLETLKDILSYV